LDAAPHGDMAGAAERAGRQIGKFNTRFRFRMTTNASRSEARSADEAGVSVSWGGGAYAAFAQTKRETV